MIGGWLQAHDVVVVDPRCDARCAEVAVTSCSSAVLHSMRVMPTLADALADCTGEWRLN
jgi:tRNA C32,U32 (ribose-2'-O)-methylase TrmJ